MRHNYLILLSLLLVGIALLFQSNANGPASNGNRATGAPGDGTPCTSCHTGGSFGPVSIDLLVEDGQGTEVTEYIAGQKYDLTVSVNHNAGSPAGFGFQMICLQNSDNSNVSGWSNPSSNAQLSTSSGRNYVEHNAPSASNQFMVEWTAPATGTGDVTFYLGANAVNGNNANSLDNATLTSISMAEIEGDTNDSIPAGFTNDILSQPGLFPNPALNAIHLIGFEQGDVYSIWSVKGELLGQDRFENAQIDVHELPSGYYFIRKEASSEVLRFVKL